MDGRCDDRVVVSPADSVYQGQWPVRGDSKIKVKGLKWSVLELLAGSPYADRFTGGVFTHSFLNVNDYHWFHVPVSGVVKEVRKISGRVTTDVIKKPDGSLAIVDGTGYQVKTPPFAWPPRGKPRGIMAKRPLRGSGSV